MAGIVARKLNRAFGSLVRRDKIKYAEKWPYKVRALFRMDGDRLVRLMTCPICGNWWERPVGSSLGCGPECIVEVRRIIRETRISSDLRYYE